MGWVVLVWHHDTMYCRYVGACWWWAEGATYDEAAILGGTWVQLGAYEN